MGLVLILCPYELHFCIQGKVTDASLHPNPAEFISKKPDAFHLFPAKMVAIIEFKKIAP